MKKREDKSILQENVHLEKGRQILHEENEHKMRIQAKKSCMGKVHTMPKKRSVPICSGIS